MKRLVTTTFVTLDGVMQAPGGPEEDESSGFKYGGWQAPFSDDAIGAFINENMSKPFDLLLGRKTYDIFASYWPLHLDNPIGRVPEGDQIHRITFADRSEMGKLTIHRR